MIRQLIARVFWTFSPWRLVSEPAPQRSSILVGAPHTSNWDFILMLGITMVAAPGVPGGAIMAALGILESMLGFDETAQALMIALYIAMDSFGTACNVTGDGAIAVVVDRINGKSGHLMQRP